MVSLDASTVPEGIAKGFVWGWPVSMLVFIIGLWA